MLHKLRIKNDANAVTTNRLRLKHFLHRRGVNSTIQPLSSNFNKGKFSHKSARTERSDPRMRDKYGTNLGLPQDLVSAKFGQNWENHSKFERNQKKSTRRWGIQLSGIGSLAVRLRHEITVGH